MEQTLNNSLDFAEECETPRNCTFTNDVGDLIIRQCYIDVNWIDKSGFCDCSSWYGFRGENCDEHTFQSRYFQTVLILRSVCCMILLFFLLWELFRYCYCLHRVSQLKWKKLNYAFSVGVFSSIGLVFLIVHGMIQHRSFIDPTRFQIEGYFFLLLGSFEDVTVINGGIAVSSLFAAYTFFVLATMQVSLSWLEVAHAMWMHFDPKLQKRIERFRKVIKFSAVLFCISQFILFPFQLYNGIGVTVMCMSVILIVLFIVGRRSFMKAIALTSQTAQEDFKQAILVVKSSSFYHVIFLSLLAGFSLAYTLTLPIFQLYIGVGDFNYVLAFRDIATFSSIVLVTMNACYIRKVFRRLVEKESKTTTMRQTPSI